jgi:hypothetical protein
MINKKELVSINNFGESMLKGRMAETLVEELLRKSGNTVYRFGYEAIMQNLIQIKKDFDKTHSVVGERIRSIPDFVIIDKNGDPLLLEVKYRWNGKIHEDDIERLKRIQSFWKAKIIFVNCSEKPFFRISNSPYLDKDNHLVSSPLIEETSWKIDKIIYDEFEALIEKYLTPTLIKK